MANLAKQIDKKTFKTTNDTAFADMASACKKCAKQFGTRLVKKNNLYGISIEQKVEEETEKVEEEPRRVGGKKRKTKKHYKKHKRSRKSKN